MVLHLTRTVPTKGSRLPRQVRARSRTGYAGFFVAPPATARKAEAFLVETPMELIVNGAAEQAAEQTNVADFLTARGHDATAVVVERNGDIVPRDAFAVTTLMPGDRLEIVQFVGGG